jgi:hypothetical protein
MKNLDKFQRMKEDYEQVIAPALIDQLNSFNNSYINSIREQIALFKEEIDADQYKYL